jgi:hypothetical protein
MTESQAAANAKNPRTARVLMFDVSLPWANFWYDAFNVMLFVGAFAVAVGTYGSIKMGAIKERFSDERTTALETQTEQAKAELGTAQADIAKANAQIAGANETAAKANERAAALEKEAAQARTEQERLKGQLAWRRVSQELYNRLVVAMRAVKLSGPLDVAFPLGDAEAATLAADIIKALKAGGITIKGDGASAAAFMPTPPTGIIVGQPGTDKVAHPFSQALADAGIPIMIEVGVPELKLVVGSKPSPF